MDIFEFAAPLFTLGELLLLEACWLLPVPLAITQMSIGETDAPFWIGVLCVMWCGSVVYLFYAQHRYEKQNNDRWMDCHRCTGDATLQLAYLQQSRQKLLMTIRQLRRSLYEHLILGLAVLLSGWFLPPMLPIAVLVGIRIIIIQRVRIRQNRLWERTKALFSKSQQQYRVHYIEELLRSKKEE